MAANPVDTDMTHRALMFRISIIIGALNIFSMVLAGVGFVAWVAGWQATTDQRIAVLEKQAAMNREDIRSVTTSINGATRELAVLNERIRPLAEFAAQEMRARNMKP